MSGASGWYVQFRVLLRFRTGTQGTESRGAQETQGREKKEAASMDKSHAQAQKPASATPRPGENATSGEQAELEATINALRQIRQNPKATPGESWRP